jgi:hypothetical protein
MRFRNPGIDPIARVNAARGILAAPPGIWTRNRIEELSAPQDGLHSRATLPSDRCHLNHTAVLIHGHRRDDAAIGKEYLIERTIGVHQNMVALAFYLLKLRRKPLEIGRWHRKQQTIFCGVR